MTLPKAAPRLVLDTNIVLSALVFSAGRLAHWRARWQGEALVPLVSQATAAELIRTLAYPKFKLTPIAQAELLADYLPFAEVVVVPNPPPITPSCRDPADIPFLQLALASNAQALVTGDKNLLAASDVFSCRILTPEEWLREFE